MENSDSGCLGSNPGSSHEAMKYWGDSGKAEAPQVLVMPLAALTAPPRPPPASPRTPPASPLPSFLGLGNVRRSPPRGAWHLSPLPPGMFFPRILGLCPVFSPLLNELHHRA